LRIHNVELDANELLRLRVMDAYQTMVCEGKVNVRYLCRLMGIGKSTFYKWKKRYKRFNLTTIKSYSRRPKSLRTISWQTVVEICQWKRDYPAKSHYYLYQLWIKRGRTPPCSPKTIYNWWKRRNLIIARHRRKRRPTRLFNHASVPGELVQLDTKFLEGRRRYQYTAIDVVTKWRYLRAYKHIGATSTVDFLERLLTRAKSKDIKLKRIQTDNGSEFQTEPIKYLKEHNINHQYTWIHTPDQNGCVERSHKTDDDEFYHLVETRDLTLEELNKKLEEWTNYYNTQRLHFSLDFDTLEEYLQKHKVSTI